MEPIWTIEAISLLISSIVMLTAVLAFFTKYRKSKAYIIFLFGFSLLLYSVHWIMMSLSIFLLDPLLFKIAHLIIPIYSLFLVVSYNLIHYGKLHPVQFIFGAVINGLLILSLIYVDSVEFYSLDNGNPSIRLFGMTKYFLLISYLYIGIVFFYYSSNIFNSAPDIYKWHSTLPIIGGLFFIGFPPILILLNSDHILPGITGFMAMIGIVVVISAYYFSPFLLYILPFKAINLSVYRRDNGELLYRHIWSEDETETEDNELVYLFIEGVSNFSDEFLHLGQFRQVDLTHGSLLIRSLPAYNLIFVLLSTRANEVLERGLEEFAKVFTLENIDVFENIEDLGNVTRIVAEKRLIRMAFPFVPTYLP